MKRGRNRPVLIGNFELSDFEVGDIELPDDALSVGVEPEVAEDVGASKTGSGPVGVFRYQFSTGSSRHSPTVTDFGKSLVTR